MTDERYIELCAAVWQEAEPVLLGVLDAAGVECNVSAGFEGERSNADNHGYATLVIELLNAAYDEAPEIQATVEDAMRGVTFSSDRGHILFASADIDELDGDITLYVDFLVTD